MSRTAADAAASHLDRVFCMDIDQGDLRSVGRDYDVVVIGDLLEHLREPERMLETLHDLTSADATVVCCIPNMAHLSVVQRLVAGDISYDDVGLLDRTHTRFFSQPSAFKTFLDGGWLPHLQDAYRVEVAPTGFAAHIIQAAEALGVPRATAIRNLGLYQMIVVCRKWSIQQLLKPGRKIPFSVIVPVNKPWQHDLNVARSPGLQEVGAEVICITGAESAAAAYAAGAVRATHDWRILAHQDVYFPRGSGLQIAQQFGWLDEQGLREAPAGFAGLQPARNPKTGLEVEYAGLVIDRTALFDHGTSDGAISMDEFAVAIHRDCAVSIDEQLGWHLWATDLCLQALGLGQRKWVPRILQVPLFHNSLNDYSLPAAFHQSAERLLAKYPQWARISTLCGELTRAPQSESRSSMRLAG